MGNICSSLCGSKEEEKATNTNTSPVKEQPEVATRPPLPVKQEPKQTNMSPTTYGAATTKPEKNTTKKSSDTGSSSHISIKDFTWLKVTFC